jgi:hypothetical protein
MTVGWRRRFVLCKMGYGVLDRFNRIRWIESTFQIETAPLFVMQRIFIMGLYKLREERKVSTFRHFTPKILFSSVCKSLKVHHCLLDLQHQTSSSPFVLIGKFCFACSLPIFDLS